MRKKISLAFSLLFFLALLGQAQPTFTEYTIDTNYGNANSVYAIDVDGDGDDDLHTY